MIDRHARDGLAELIRHFLVRLTDNFQYNDAAFDIDTKDRGVIEIRNAIWLVYDDLRRHRLEGKWALSKEQSDVIKRAIVFLKSDYAYARPVWPLYYQVARPALFIVSIGLLTKLLDQYFHGDADSKFWPFLSGEDYEKARMHPIYLAGTRYQSVHFP